MQNLMNDLTKLFQKDDRIFAAGTLFKNKLTELALKFDSALIDLLLSDKKAKEHFFSEKTVKKEKVLVFDKDKFTSFVNNKEFLPDSFTSFKNKIGLMDNGDYIKEKNDVVLAWAYKDCVLEGGQDKEDQKRDEVFYNETLAPDEIDRLFESKVLTNFKRYDSKGEHQATGFSAEDNLIIKGNNLLALRSLEQKYRGKIKLIYIDPPFNTGNDEFRYNDRFNHSTWLTFMKNRLKVAKELLRPTGSIFVHIDNNEFAYLSIMLDELFGRDNFITCITVERSAATGHKAINPSPVNVSDYILGYAKERARWKYITQHVPRDYDPAYSLFIQNFKEDYSKWKFINLSNALSEQNLSLEQAIDRFSDRIIRFAEPSYTGVGKETRRLIDLSKTNPSKIYKQEREDYADIYLKNGQRILFYKNKMKNIDGKLVTADALTTVWKDIPFQGIAKEGGVVLRKGKKPEKLLKRIIAMASENGDIILDYHLGSGTTATVAHKMGRQYIGIEQLDYGENDSVVRLNNVINGDKSGISKSVNWKGGGSFVYMELKKWNEEYMAAIQEAKTTPKLLSIYKKMKKEAFFRYDIDLSKFDEKEFKKLSTEEQQQVLCECLDKNHLYVNLSEINDATYKISAEDKKLNKQFYKPVF